jgi:hypothetical protein
MLGDDTGTLDVLVYSSREAFGEVVCIMPLDNFAINGLSWIKGAVSDLERVIGSEAGLHITVE